MRHSMSQASTRLSADRHASRNPVASACQNTQRSHTSFVRIPRSRLAAVSNSANVCLVKSHLRPIRCDLRLPRRFQGDIHTAA